MHGGKSFGSICDSDSGTRRLYAGVRLPARRAEHLSRRLPLLARWQVRRAVHRQRRRMRRRLHLLRPTARARATAAARRVPTRTAPRSTSRRWRRRPSIELVLDRRGSMTTNFGGPIALPGAPRWPGRRDGRRDDDPGERLLRRGAVRRRSDAVHRRSAWHAVRHRLLGAARAQQRDGARHADRRASRRTGARRPRRDRHRVADFAANPPPAGLASDHRARDRRPAEQLRRRRWQRPVDQR